MYDGDYGLGARRMKVKEKDGGDGSVCSIYSEDGGEEVCSFLNTGVSVRWWQTRVYENSPL